MAFGVAVPSLLALIGLYPSLIQAAPSSPLEKHQSYAQYYDVQGHRGARGQAVENTLAAFAWALTSGATTLELDNGITKDGHVIVWHDESVDSAKCKDTAPVTQDDPNYPYVGKYVANLTLAQIKTLDCGSLRQAGYPFQLLYPGHKLATLGELFDFVRCTQAPILYNIESKVDPVFPNITRGPEVFVEKQLAVFEEFGLIDRIVYQSFDWRTIKQSKALKPALRTSALVDDTTLYARIGEADATSGPSDWLAGIDINSFPGSSVGAKVAQAAASIGANVLSPAAVSSASNFSALDPSFPGYTSFVNSSMVDTAHELGLKAAPWTVDRLNTVEQLQDLGIDGIITDYPEYVRNWALEKGYKVAPRVDYDVVNKCFHKHAQFTDGKSRYML